MSLKFKQPIKKWLQEHKTYLNTIVSLTGIEITLLILTINYLLAGPNSEYTIWVGAESMNLFFTALLIALLVLLVILLSKITRKYIYLISLLVIVFFIGMHTIYFAHGSQYLGADRDTALVIAARSLLQLNNPWDNITQLGGVIDTGPTSILLALPFVKIFSSTNLLNFLFYIILVALFLQGDVTKKNNSFILIVTLILFFNSGFWHNFFWTLGEYYYGIPFLFAAWLATNHQRNSLAGALLAAALWVRVSYLLLIFAFLGWWLFYYWPGWKQWLRLITGGIISSLIIWLPFLFICGQSLLDFNPIMPALKFNKSDWPDVNIIFHNLNTLSQLLGNNFVVLKLILAISVALGLALLLRKRYSQPFLHITILSFLSITIFWSPKVMADYQLIYMIPALLFVSHHKSTAKFQECKCDS